MVKAIAPGFGGINLEDISAPRCFEVERRLRELLDIPVFHDDQHGTAIVVLAALTNALRCVHKRLEDVRVVVAGAGAAGTAVVDLLLAAGARDLLVWDREGILCADRRAAEPSQAAAGRGDQSGRRDRRAAGGVDRRGRGHRRVRGRCHRPGRRAAMDPGPIVFALANPDPEVDPDAARAVAAVIATGRSDYPNQINNVLAFPGVFRGLLDARARNITTSMLLSAAAALAAVVTDDELNPSYVVPSVFDPEAPKAVAAAVAAAAQADPTADTVPDPD